MVKVNLDWEDDARPFLHRIVGPLGRRLLDSVWGLKVAGLDNLPRQGAAIVACNHVSNADPLVIGFAVYPVRSLRYLAKVELFRVPVVGWFIHQVGAIPLDRSRADVAAVRSAVAVLDKGRCLAIFPEGTRSKDGRAGRPKAGVGYLAGQTGAPVVPARLVNTDRLLSFRSVEVRFGPPLRFAGDPGDRRRCQDFAHMVMDRVFSL